MGKYIWLLLRNLGREEELKEPLFSQPRFIAVKGKKVTAALFSFEIYIPHTTCLKLFHIIFDFLK